jgi:hypothetical protein
MLHINKTSSAISYLRIVGKIRQGAPVEVLEGGDCLRGFVRKKRHDGTYGTILYRLYDLIEWAIRC